MNVKIAELMVSDVRTLKESDSIGHAREMVRDHDIGAIPVVTADGEAAGIVSTKDLVGDLDDGIEVREVMTSPVYSIPQYNDVHHAARLMRNHKLHHVIVTHEKQIVGILSAFDLLKLVEEHRFVMKQAPGATKRASRRQ